MKRKRFKSETFEEKMGFGEYISLFTFGILSTGAVAFNPQDLPLLIMGAFVISIILMKIINSTAYKVGKLSYGFVIFSLIAGISAVIGIIITSTKQSLSFQLNGIIWMFMSITIMKFNIESIPK